MDQHPDTAAIEHVFQAWDDALGAKDLDASMALYHRDATLESPLVCHLLGTEEGVVRGRAALRRFVEQVFAHQPPQRRRFRTGLLTDGARLTWEYPRELIAHHHVYWGWLGVNNAQDWRPPQLTIRRPLRGPTGVS